MADKDDDYYSTDGDLVTDSEDEIQGYEDFDGTDVELAELLPFWSGTHRKFKWCKRCPGHIESSKMAVKASFKREMSPINMTKWFSSDRRPWWPGEGRVKFQNYFVYTIKNKDLDDIRDLVQKAVQEGFDSVCDYSCECECIDEEVRMCIHYKQQEFTKIEKSLHRRLVRSAGDQGIFVKNLLTETINSYWCSKIRPISLQEQAAASLATLLRTPPRIKKLVEMKKIPFSIVSMIREYI